MTHFRKIWDEEKNNFLFETKDLPISESYKLFLEKWPQSEVTRTAFSNQRSRIGAAPKRKNPWSTRHRPIGGEHCKKGYIRIKIGEPNVWMFKHHYVFWQATGIKPNPRTEIVLFLDGDTRNFNPENLYLISRKTIGIFNNKHFNLGTVKGNPEATLTNIKCAELILKTFEVAKKNGMINPYGRFYSDVNENARKKRLEMTPEQKQKEKERIKQRWIEIKNDPIKREKLKLQRKIWYEKNKERILKEKKGKLKNGK